MTTTNDLPSVDGSSLPPVLYVPCVVKDVGGLVEDGWNSVFT